MARVYTNGAEYGDTYFWNGTFSGGAVTASTTYKRSGNYSYRVGSGNPGAVVKSISPLSEMYKRFGWLTPAYYSGTIFGWAYSGTLLGNLYFNSTTHYLSIQVGGSTVATGTIPLSTEVFYLIEVYIKIADSGGTITVKIDGVQDSTYTGDTKPGTATTVDELRHYCWAAGNYQYFDDLALNDTTGGSDNSWCGEGKVILLTTNGNGDASQLTGSDGNQTDNYLLVDDIPKDDDTTYVEGSVVDERDLYNLTACGLSNVSIQRVQVGATARDTVASGGKIALTLKTGGTEYSSSDQSLLTTYTRVLGAEYKTNPATSVAWTVSDLDALQVGPTTR